MLSALELLAINLDQTCSLLWPERAPASPPTPPARQPANTPTPLPPRPLGEPRLCRACSWDLCSCLKLLAALSRWTWKPPPAQRALLELQRHLCTETEPSKLYQTLQKLSSLPKLRDPLAEMNFEQTMKLLRKEQLLVPFAKDLAAICPGPSPSPSPSPGLGASLSPHTRLQRKVTSSPRLEPRGSKRPRVSLGEPQLAAQNRVPVAKPRASREEPWRLPAPKAISSESGAGGKTPGHRMEEGAPADPLEACLNSDSSPPSSALQLQLTGCKRRAKSTWKAEEALSPGAKVPRGESPRSQDPKDTDTGVLAGHPLAQEASSLQAGFPLGGPEHTDQDSPPWARRTHLKTPVYSGPAPARLLQNSQGGRLAEPLDRPWKTRCQDTAQESEPWLQGEESRHQTHTGKPSHTKTPSATILQLQESPELRLQALRARLQGAQAKKPPGRQTKMMAFQAQGSRLCPGQQAEPAARGAASSEMSSRQEASAHRPPGRAPCLWPPQASNKTQPKKRRAPLMAKTLRDYKKKLSGR
ncbi:elongin-A3-like [Peromyscus californicus insignis]|uniref:elongin-A3-like n=1 Tax=Peromyscus californicus insignis TaxID=564181 RepID=UPI0022A6F87E|nr:elongin-A3-like [Peromyscus californicus insignis]